jgi:ligand-binding SRPBCC domain-containing protein
MVVDFECRTRMPVGVQEAFDRSRSIDLHLSSMAHSRERAIAGVRGGLIAETEEVTWRAWHFGVPICMTSRITRMSPPDSFVDEQVHGPFKSFWHEHRFVADGDGTLMIDRVAFTAPLGVLGRLAEVVLGPYVRRLIEQRNVHLREASVPEDASGDLSPLPGGALGGDREDDGNGRRS